jgi:hypothetical protein
MRLRRPNKNSKVWEIRLYKIEGIPINRHESVAWGVITDLHELVFKDDPNWHFFWEGWYNIIRFSKVFRDEVKEYLDENEIEYVEEGFWVDGQRMTRLYQDLYKPMFHSFSELAIRDKGENIRENLDRVIHCFLNHQFFVVRDIRESQGGAWEPNLIGENLINRSFYLGECNGIIKTERYFSERTVDLEEDDD